MIRALLRWWRGCWLRGHFFVEDRPMSLDGRFAMLAGLWMPSGTCKRCGAKNDPANEQYADERGWRES